MKATMLPETELIDKVRNLIANAELESAVDTVNAFLEERKGAYKELSNLALQIKSQFEKTQKDETLGIVSQENVKLSYNQITNQLVLLLGQLESPKTAVAARKKSYMAIGGIVVLLALITAAVFYFVNGGVQQQAADGPCPSFEKNSVFNVLVWPFRPLEADATKVLDTHGQIKTRLADFSESIPIKASILNPNVKPDDFSVLPGTNSEAENSGSQCHSNLVIWGTTERKKDDRIIITTRYNFIQNGNNFQFGKLVIGDDANVGTVAGASSISTEGIVVDTVTSLSSIATEGAPTKKIESILQILFGVLAHESGDEENAVKILSTAQTQDSSASLLSGMALADSYWKMGQPDKAEASLDKVLDQHPNYWLALNNRAMIYYKKGKYAEAVSDLSRQIENKPENTDALLNRAGILLEMDQVDHAENDLKRVREVLDSRTPPDKNVQQGDTLASDGESTSRILDRRVIELKDKRKEQEDRKVKADAILQRDPRNLDALIDKAEASINLGDKKEAAEASGKALAIDSRNSKAIAIQLEATRDTRKFPQILEQTKATGVRKEELLKERPLLREVLETRKENN
ncbi:MAG TPA: tetratricopeptide repeat protein [Flavilitoribacter sp.]|nr:tetratricopeptide repeat protein [Flavilitoribacter sp.]